MAFVPLNLPPGIFRNGTQYQQLARWYDGNLIRWVEGAMQPIGGWQHVQSGGADVVITADKPTLGTLAWRSSAGAAYLAAGLPATCFAYNIGVLTDITPASGFTGGNADATTSQNYGVGNYGDGVYGEGDLSQTTIVEAQSWQFDAFGQNLVAVAWSDGKLYQWDLNVSNNLAVVDGTAPTGNVGCVVTPERFLVALGAGGDLRKVQWADQASLTLWTAASTNQAGEFLLACKGDLMAGRRGRGETLIWTTNELFTMRWVGGTTIYRFDLAGNQCGPISRRAMTVVDGGRAFWMGSRSFFTYDGAVRSVPSTVSDYIFTDINRVQQSKIHCVSDSEFHEIRWYYCSAASDEIDRYVIYNYLENTWFIGKDLNRTAAVDRGVFNYPMAFANTGDLYDHERGTTYLATDDATAIVPFAESGPIEIGQGDQTMVIRQIISDEKTLGDVTAKLHASLYPTATETTFGPFTLAEPTSVRLLGRQVRLRLDQVTPEWRVGTVRLDIVPAGGR